MAIYYVWSGAAGSGTGASWVNAFTTLTTAFATELAGDTLFVAHDHAESTATTVTLTSSGTVALPTKIICADRAGTVPPISADRRTTAQVTLTSNGTMTFNGVAHYDGIIFVSGNSTGAGNINLSGTNGALRFDNCSLRCGSTGATGKIIVGGLTSGQGTYVELNNTTVQFSHASQAFQIAGLLKWRNTPSALLGTIPNELFVPSTGNGGGYVESIGVDFSAAGSGKTLVGTTGTGAHTPATFMFVDCKLHASVTKSELPFSLGENQIDFVRCGSSGINYTVHRHRYNGLLVEETTIVRTGGASDGTTTISWKIDTTANCSYSMPFECPPIATWVDTGVPVTATVEGVWGAGAVPNDDDIWLDVEYLGDNSSPQGSFINDGKADPLATAAGQTSSSATWGGSTTKFKLAVTFTPQQRGWIYCRVKCAKASTTFYIDPLVTIT